MARRVRYNRGNLDSAIAAARQIVDDHPVYIYATAGGFTIDHQRPPFGQQHVKVSPGGHVEVVERTTSLHGAGKARYFGEPGRVFAERAGEVFGPFHSIKEAEEFLRKK